ncbi:MAG: hypothetical protein CVU22_07035 [Betaproteobacteria bacterium HGW-Betaproteobacteria-16]|nr:MAG: hypothetical protein CVU22_07035 [Betaproteobacteria bacterium HGW-Betaproteobacteria-16]
MTNSIAKISDQSEAQLSRVLKHLQETASVVSAQMRSSNMAFYKHLAELYLWWHAASSVPGYLDAEYKKVGKRRAKPVQHGINFSPLFRLTWGYNNGLTDDKCRRWSIVLNKLHDLYQTEAQYRTESVTKFQLYIHNKGGVEGFINDGKSSSSSADDEDVSDEEFDAKQPVEPARVTTDEMLAQLFEQAKTFYGALHSQPIIDLDATIPVTADGMSTVLVRKVGDQYQLIGASSDEAFVKPVAMQTYLNDYSALPWSMQALMETVSTQCLPSNLQSFYSALEDSSSSTHDGEEGGKQLKSVRRLLYVHSSGEFILSPIRAVSGVVTVAKPSRPILENPDKDVCLSTRSRRLLEKKLISGRNFNLFSPSNAEFIPQYTTPNLASHVLRLQDRFDVGEFLHLDFWPFYKSMAAAQRQVTVDESKPRNNGWYASLSLAWLRKFSLEFTTPWLATHGTHIKRAHQQIIQVTFDTKELRVDFVYRDEQFEASVGVALPASSASGPATKVLVRSKDFVVAMQSIADLGITSKIELHVNTDAVVISYTTSAAGYQVYVPTCTTSGVRSSRCFKLYTPNEASEFEDYNDQAEGDFDPE